MSVQTLKIDHKAPELRFSSRKYPIFSMMVVEGEMSMFMLPCLLLKRSYEFASISEGALGDKDPSTLQASSGEIKSRSSMLMSPGGNAGYSSIGNRSIYSEILINRGKIPGDEVRMESKRQKED